MVGSIEWTKPVGANVHKGEELGYFAFGGSTVIVLFQKDRIVLDIDLVNNSKQPIETYVQVGHRLGHASP